MIHLKSKAELKKMRLSGKLLAQTFDALATKVKIGVTAAELDRFIYHTITGFGATPSFLGYSGYKYSSCISKNEEVVHGLPLESKMLFPGDICSIDIGVFYQGYHADACRIFMLEPLDPTIEKLCSVTERSFYESLKDIGPGSKLGDIGYALQEYVEAHNFSVVRDLYSHGIGKKLHEDPLIPNYAKKGTGIVLEPGFTFALEPMVNIGVPDVVTLSDDWTIITEDYMCSAHYENTVAITDSGYEILTILS